jgi:hypothetical protein
VRRRRGSAGRQSDGSGVLTAPEMTIIIRPSQRAVLVRRRCVLFACGVPHRPLPWLKTTPRGRTELIENRGFECIERAHESAGATSCRVSDFGRSGFQERRFSERSIEVQVAFA